MNKRITLNGNGTQMHKSRGYSKLFNTMCSFILLLTVFAAGCKKDDFEGEIVGLCPVVTTDPIDKAVDVVLNKVITATFNTNMDPKTINSATFTIKQGANLIEGTVAPTALGTTFTFTPKVPLLPFTTYTGTITTGATDTLRTAMVADYVWTFTTIPQVTVSATPVLGGMVLGAGQFKQASSVTVVADPNAGYVFTNWTSNGTVVSTNPAYTFNMAGNQALVANFTQASANFSVVVTSNPAAGGTTSGAGNYNSGASVTLTAIPNSGYTFTSWSGDASGSTNPLTFVINSNRSIQANFTAGGPVIAPGVGPGPINLGTAGDFSILSKAGISTTGVSLVNGDIGVSPAAATAITGFGLIMDTNGQSSHSPIVTGKIYASDYAAPTPAKMTTAVSNMETAFTTLNNLITPAPVLERGAGNISGLNLAPGLYKWSTGVLIDPNTAVTLTGGPNDTWVFQIAQNLTVSNSARVTLAGGAQAKNVYWVVSGQATLGTLANFSGNILSKTLISLNTGAVVTGKLLAQTAVTLNASTVIKP